MSVGQQLSIGKDGLQKTTTESVAGILSKEGPAGTPFTRIMFHRSTWAEKKEGRVSARVNESWPDMNVLWSGDNREMLRFEHVTCHPKTIGIMWSLV